MDKLQSSKRSNKSKPTKSLSKSQRKAQSGNKGQANGNISENTIRKVIEFIMKTAESERKL